MLADDLHDLLFIYLAGAEGVDVDGSRLCNADRIGELDLRSVGIACCHQVLCDITGCIGSASVDLGAVLAGEASAAVTACSAVGVDDDLTAGKTCIALGSADDETTGGIDVDLGVIVDHGGINNGIDHVFADIFMDLLLCDFRIMLCGDNDRIKAYRMIILIIFHRDLGLSVGTKVRKRTVLADLCQPSGELVGKVDGIRHILGCFVGRITEHHALVAGADRFDLFVGHLVFPGLQCLVNAHRDIRALLVKSYQNGAGIAVKSLFGAVIADLEDRLTDDLRIIHDCLGGNLTGKQYKARAGNSLARNTAHGILRDAGIKDRIGNGIADLVGMSFCYGFRCKNKFLQNKTSFGRPVRP